PDGCGASDPSWLECDGTVWAERWTTGRAGPDCQDEPGPPVESRAGRSGSGSRVEDRLLDLVEIGVAQDERCRSDPAVDLFGRACTDDRGSDLWPCARPCNRNRTGRGAVTPCDRAECIAQCEVAFDVRRAEPFRSAAPVVFRQILHAL